MACKKWSVRALFVAGILILGIGQYAYWALPRDGSSTSTSIPRRSMRPDFVIKETKAVPFPGGTPSQGMLRVRLVNRLNRPVTLLGSSGGCRPWACCEALNLPQEIGAGGAFWLEIKTDWRGDREKSFPMSLFTSLSLTEFVHLEVLPDDAAIVAAESEAEDN